MPSLCLWQSHPTNIEGQCGLGTSAILDCFSSACGAGSGQACCRCSPVPQIYSPRPTYLQANSSQFLDVQQSGVLSFLLPQKYRKYLSPQKVFPSEIWDWIIYTGLHNTGSSLLSSTIPALTDGSPGPFQSWGPGSSRTHSPLLKTELSIYACPSRLPIISSKPVGLFLFQLFQPVSAGLIQSRQHQKSLGPYTYYIKLQQREEGPK